MGFEDDAEQSIGRALPSDERQVQATKRVSSYRIRSCTVFMLARLVPGPVELGPHAHFEFCRY
jgi:hypothetical protein